MTFEYLQRIIVDAQLDVENIGECVIRGRNDLGEEYYLIIRTEMGWTEQLNYGPVTPEVPASILQMHPNVILVGDEEALSLLK